MDRPVVKRRRIERRPLHEETSYYFENGLRKVKPYEFEYKSHAKGRWVGRAVLDMFQSEFVDCSPTYYAKAFEAGLITINGAKVPPSYTIKNNDVVRHLIFRHEPPVCADPIDTLYIDSDVVVVNKPGSIPVHPSGRYRHNTVLYILEREHNLADLHLLHRLDRLTSGVLVLCRNTAKAKELQEQMRAHELVKEYVCRVRGEFPADEIEVDQPIRTYDFKLGMNVVAPDGKPCRTVFRRISYNGTTSVVHCRPFTGRTHQIRVHLQWLGFPIANDPLYSSIRWGTSLGKGGLTEEDLSEVAQRFRADRVALDEAGTLAVQTADTVVTTTETTSADAQNNSCADASTDVSVETAPDEQQTPSGLGNERVVAPLRLPNLRRDPLPHELLIWLHAQRYTGPNWTYEAPLPSWAKDDFADDAWVNDSSDLERFAAVSLSLDGAEGGQNWQQYQHQRG